MKIEINNLRKIFSIQDEFTRAFPNLKIEFYEYADKGGTRYKHLIKTGSKTLGECRTQSKDGVIEIKSGMTIGELKNIFKETYGLNVDMFQRSVYSNLDGSWVSDATILEPVVIKEDNSPPVE